MNTKSNQRFQETDQKIRQVFLQLLSEKDLSHTTVQDICRGCNINRSTFYAHYTDIYDLLAKMESSIRMDIFDSYRNTDITLDNFLAPNYFEIIIDHIRRHQTFYRAYLDGCGKDAIEEGFQQLGKYVFRPYLVKQGITSESQIKYRFTFLNSGFVAVIKQWLDEGCAETPHELAIILWNSMNSIAIVQ